MFSNINGEPVFLEKFHGVDELADKNELPMLVLDPANPLTAPMMDKMRIPYQLWGYTLDTSMAVVSMIFQGLFQKFKKVGPSSTGTWADGPLLCEKARRLLQGVWQGMGH